MGISDALGLSKPEPPPAAAATYKPGDDLVKVGEVAPLNAGKTVGDTKPNAVEPPPPIEFIHFGRLHKSRANVFPHPKYEPPEKPAPSKSAGASSEQKSSSAPPSSKSSGSGSSSSSGGSKSGGDDELQSNPLFRKQAEKNDAEWLKDVDPTPGTGNAPVQPAPSPEEAAEKDSGSKSKPDESSVDEDDSAPDAPAGQAVLMRDALLRESILLRNFVASTVAVYKEWKAGQLIPNPFAPKGDRLDHVKDDVAKAAKAINAEDAAYADLHEAGLEFHRARATHAGFADDDLDGYFGKPLPGLDKLMPDVPGLGPLLKPMFFMTLNTYGVYYRVYLAIRRAYEPVIEEICRRRSVAAILNHEPEPYNVWASEGGENAITQIFARIVGQTDLPELDPPSKDDQKKDAEDDAPIGEDALDVPPAAELIAEAMAVACKSEKLGDPIGTWVRKWVQWDAEALEKVYKKLPATLKTPDKAIDDDFVQAIIAPSTTAKTLKTINCTFDLIITSLRATSAFKDTGTAFVATCKAGLDHDEMPEVRAAKARSEYTEERGKLEAEAKKPEAAANAGKKLKDLDNAEKLKVESEKGEMQAAVAKGDITQSEYNTWLKARTEDPDPDGWDKMEQYLKEIEKYRDDIKSAVEKLNELTITAIATDLEAARAEAAGSNALTMEAYLGRLPRLLALLTLNTTMIAWKLALGGLFDVILRDVDTEITQEIKSFREGDNFAKKFAKDKAGEENYTKAEQGATKAIEGVKELYKAAHKDPAKPVGFPPDERIPACTGKKITKKDREEAADQVRKTDSPKGKVDKPPPIFLKVE